MSTQPSEPVMLKGSDLALGLVALVAEIVVFAALVFLVRELGGGAGTGTILASIAIVATIVLWGRYMAPKGARRLPTSRRVLVAAALALVVGAGLIAIDQARWGYVVLAAGSVLSLVQWRIGERMTHRADSRSRPDVPEPRDG